MRPAQPFEVMSESYIQNLFAECIGGRQYGKSQAIYKFEKIKRAKRAALARSPGAEIIDLGIGEPDEMAFPEAVEKLCAEARKHVQVQKPIATNLDTARQMIDIARKAGIQLGVVSQHRFDDSSQSNWRP